MIDIRAILSSLLSEVYTIKTPNISNFFLQLFHTSIIAIGFFIFISCITYCFTQLLYFILGI